MTFIIQIGLQSNMSHKNMLIQHRLVVTICRVVDTILDYVICLILVIKSAFTSVQAEDRIKNSI